MNYKLRLIDFKDLEKIVEIFLDYYNNYEDENWTEERAFKRILQIYNIDDSMSFKITINNKIIGFVLGYKKVYGDLSAYKLEEILIMKKYQNQGIGSSVMKEIEKILKKENIELIELVAINDNFHEKFYGKLGYFDGGNLKLKGKFI